MKEYTFNLKGWGTVKIEAPTKAIAKEKIKQYKNDNTKNKLQPTSRHK